MNPSAHLSTLLAAVILLGGCTDPERAPRRTSLADGRLWYVGDGELDGGRTRLLLFNPGERSAAITLRVYLERNEPRAVTWEVEPGQVVERDLAALEALPRGEPFWLAIEADIPVLPQLVHAYSTSAPPAPDALLSVAPYPGPLSWQTTWVHPDCFVGGGEHWFENETITVLNPGKEAVTVRLTYLRDGRAAVEVLEIPAERIIALDAGSRHPRLDDGTGDPIGVGGNYALRIDATAPVVTEMTRRARLPGESHVVGARSSIGFPLPDPAPRTWHYAGGYDARSAPGGGEPWNLLFVLNLDPSRPVDAELVFHGGQGRRGEYPDIAIPPLTSDLRFLHHWLGDLVTREPWAVTVQASLPVVAELTSAEFETRDDSCPEGMTSVNLCAEPLDDRKSQWLGIGPIGVSADGGFWHQHYALFNPSPRPARVNLTFHGLAGANQGYPLVIPAAAVARVDAKDIEGLPPGKPFAVRADSDQPLCAQVVVRSTADQFSYTRAIYSFGGVPIAADALR